MNKRQGNTGLCVLVNWLFKANYKGLNFMSLKSATNSHWTMARMFLKCRNASSFAFFSSLRSQFSKIINISSSSYILTFFFPLWKSGTKLKEPRGIFTWCFKLHVLMGCKYLLWNGTHLPCRQPSSSFQVCLVRCHLRFVAEISSGTSHWGKIISILIYLYKCSSYLPIPSIWISGTLLQFCGFFLPCSNCAQLY